MGQTRLFSVLAIEEENLSGGGMLQSQMLQSQILQNSITDPTKRTISLIWQSALLRARLLECESDGGLGQNAVERGVSRMV